MCLYVRACLRARARVCVCVRVRAVRWLVVVVCVFACVYASVSVKHTAVPVHVEDSTQHICSSLISRILGAFPKSLKKNGIEQRLCCLKMVSIMTLCQNNVNPWIVEKSLN